MAQFYQDLNLIVAFFFSLLQDVGNLLTSNMVLALSVGLFVLSMVAKFFKRLINGK